MVTSEGETKKSVDDPVKELKGSDSTMNFWIEKSETGWILVEMTAE